MSEALLEMTDVTKQYGGGDHAERVLEGLSLTVQPGQTLSIVGPSGSGKSTLLNLIGALDRPSSGTVRLDGQDLADLSDKQLAHLRNAKIGFIFQLHHLLSQCSVLENVLVPTLAAGGDDASRDQAPQRARDLLERVGLGDKLDALPGQLSGGQRQRVAVVRALINQPALLLADEPTGSLDQAASDELTALLKELNAEQGVTLIVVTHAMDLARQMAEVYRLAGGRLERDEGGTS